MSRVCCLNRCGVAAVVVGLAAGTVLAQPAAPPRAMLGAREIVALLEYGRAAEAEAALRRVLAAADGRPAPAVRYLLGTALLFQQRLPEAETELAAAVAARADRPQWFHTLALCRAELGRCQGAVEALDRALALAESPGFRYDRAMCLLNLGRSAEAEADLRRVLAATSQAPTATVALGRLLRDSGRTAEARSLLLALVAQQPRAVEAQVLLGLLAADAGQHAAAVERFRAALALLPQHLGATYGLARSLAALGERAAAEGEMARFRELSRREERIETLQQYLAHEPGRVDVRRELASELLELGRLDEARRELAALARLAPTDPAVAALLERGREVAASAESTVAPEAPP